MPASRHWLTLVLALSALAEPVLAQRGRHHPRSGAGDQRSAPGRALLATEPHPAGWAAFSVTGVPW